jgi:hypothetical protein
MIHRHHARSALAETAAARNLAQRLAMASSSHHGDSRDRIRQAWGAKHGSDAEEHRKISGQGQEYCRQTEHRVSPKLARSPAPLQAGASPSRFTRRVSHLVVALAMGKCREGAEAFVAAGLSKLLRIAGPRRSERGRAGSGRGSRPVADDRNASCPPCRLIAKLSVDTVRPCRWGWGKRWYASGLR